MQSSKTLHPAPTAVELSIRGMFQPQRGGIFIVSKPQDVSSSVGAALNRTCRPAGVFFDWRSFAINMPLLRSLLAALSCGQKRSLIQWRSTPALLLSERKRVNLSLPLGLTLPRGRSPFGDRSAHARILLPRPVGRGENSPKDSCIEPLNLVGTARCPVRVACSGATIPPAVFAGGDIAARCPYHVPGGLGARSTA